MRFTQSKSRFYQFSALSQASVISLVRRITRSYSVRTLFFKVAVSSLSPRAGEGSLNNERLLFRLVEQPKSAQLPAGIM